MQALFEGIFVLLAVALAIAAALAALALFVTVGALYGSGIAFVNYWRALVANVAMEKPQP